MGGIRSGRPAGKQIQDELIRLDLRYLHRNGLLIHGVVSTLWWLQHNRIVGSITIIAKANKIVLNYRVVSSGSGSLQEVYQVVQLNWLPCTFGSTRPFYFCPNCGQQVLILYPDNIYFSCRHCLNLTYQSRNEGRVDQLLRSVRNARSKVGAAADLTKTIPPKPKWKHRNKYNRLRQEAELHEMRFLGSMDRKLKCQQNSQIA